ncbi:MAG: hypothetical protein KDA31_12130 [Phycisphaerales bacterium]|nr:hypothetical protein [Phycisphaerales bacterium]MCB9836754.1 hypothetical protein [Phycisphaera sp.]
MQSETFTVHLARQSRGQVMLREGKAPEPDARPRVPMRAARLMAMAIRIDGLVRSGEMACFAEVALVAGVSRARLSQIMDLTMLAPSIQESVLRELKPERGRDPYSERDLRRIVRDPDWRRQERAFEALTGRR